MHAINGLNVNLSIASITPNRFAETVSLEKLYSKYNSSEVLAQWIHPLMEGYPFQVKTMAAELLPHLVTAFGHLRVFETFIKEGSDYHQRTVMAKMDKFDESRIIVTAGNTVLDGNYHVIAAILLDKPVKFIDIRDFKEPVALVF